MIDRAAFHCGSGDFGLELAIEETELVIKDAGTVHRLAFSDLVEVMIRCEAGMHVFRIRARGGLTERRFYRQVHSASVEEHDLRAFLDVLAFRAPGAAVIRADGNVPHDALWAPINETPGAAGLPGVQLPHWWVIALIVAFVVALIATGAR